MIRAPHIVASLFRLMVILMTLGLFFILGIALVYVLAYSEIPLELFMGKSCIITSIFLGLSLIFSPYIQRKFVGIIRYIFHRRSYPL